MTTISNNSDKNKLPPVERDMKKHMIPTKHRKLRDIQVEEAELEIKTYKDKHNNEA